MTGVTAGGVGEGLKEGDAQLTPIVATPAMMNIPERCSSLTAQVLP